MKCEAALNFEEAFKAEMLIMEAKANAKTCLKLDHKSEILLEQILEKLNELEKIIVPEV